MPIIGGLTILLQIAFAIHAVRTGRDRTWLYFIIFVPLIGCVAYFVTQILPELGDHPNVRKAGRTLARSMNPMGELERRKAELEISDNVENRERLADECMAVDYFAEAEQLYDMCLTSHHQNDPNIRLKLAQAQFAQDNFAAARATLEDLIDRAPNFRSTTGHLLYARTLEALNETERAMTEYRALVHSFPGEEARVRYARLLRSTGDTSGANTVFDEVLTRARRAPRYYQRKEKTWIDIATRERQTQD